MNEEVHEIQIEADSHPWSRNGAGLEYVSAAAVNPSFTLRTINMKSFGKPLNYNPGIRSPI